MTARDEEEKIQDDAFCQVDHLNHLFLIGIVISDLITYIDITADLQ
jgi:hypothetical protein